MDQELDTFAAALRRGALSGTVLGAVLAAAWGGTTVEGEDAGTILAWFVVLGAFTGSVLGVACGALVALAHQVTQRLGSSDAWWLVLLAALLTGPITFAGLSLWPALFKGELPVGLQVGWPLVCAAAAAWQVRRFQGRLKYGSPARFSAGDTVNV